MTETLTIGSLEASGVLVSSNDNSFSLAPAFRETVDTYRDDTAKRLTETLEAQFDGHQAFGSLNGQAQDSGSKRFAAQLCALVEHLDDVPPERLVTAGFVVDQFAEEPLPDDGVPAGFAPIPGRRLDLVEGVFSHAIVYIWRRDCEPCDAMRETLEAMLPRFPEGAARFAVYGPDSARYLHEEYDVQGGPATLFFAGGKISSRLYGAQYEEVIETELEALGGESNGEGKQNVNQ